MLLWLLVVDALALPPNQTVRLWQVGDGEGAQVERMAVTEGGDLVVGRTRGDLQGWLLDVERWELVTFTDCDVTGAAPIELDDDTHEIWVSCSDGRLIGKTWDGQTLGTVVDSDGVSLEFDLDETLSGVWWDPASQALYAISVAGTDVLPRVHVVDPFSLAVNAELWSSYPTDLPWQDFNEATVSLGSLIVSHGGRNMSSLQLGFNGAVAVAGTFTTLFDCDDLAPNPFGGVYCVDDLGQSATYDPATNIFQLLPLGVLDDPNAICANQDLTDGWIAVTGQQVTVWEMNENGTIVTDPPYFQGPADANNQIQDMVTRDGYLYGGGVSGNLHIVTARPWVYPSTITVTPEAASDGDTVTVEFAVDEDVDWALRRGGDRDGGGTVLATGSALTDETIAVDVVVDLTYDEGVNDLYVIATNQLGLTGHAVAGVTIDNPPRPPALTDANLQFAEGALTLSFDGIPDADLDRYEVYVTTEPFEPSDWPAGGPEFDGTTNLKTPIVIQAEGGQSVTQRIAPLEDFVTYYVALHAIDTGGLEGPMSKVIKGTPQPSYTAAELAGEEGGTPCSTSGSALGSWAIVGLGALLLRRRRWAVAAVAAGLAVSPGRAAAQADDDDPWWKQDLTPSRGDFEVRYGVIQLDDENINRVYDRNPSNLLQVEVGPQFWRVAEIDVGFGFFQELSSTVAATGQPGGDRTMLTWWPLALDGTLRLHILDEQPLVPFVRYGWDYVIWSELDDDGAGGKNSTRGAKFGSHTALGLNLLLDIFQPGRASFLEAQSGINDSWITVEWRRQRVDDRTTPWGPADAPPAGQGFTFDGNAVMLGLKFDY